MKNMEKPLIKASTLKAAMAFIADKLGEESLRTILAAFNSEEITKPSLLASSWVGEETFRDLMSATENLKLKKPEESGKFFFEMGRFIAKDGIPKYYQSLIRFLDMKFLLSKSPILWKMQHTHGKFRCEMINDTSGYAYLVDYPVPNKNFCRVLEGYIYAVGELSKMHVVRVEEVECVLDGHQCCKFIGEWRNDKEAGKTG